MPNQMNLSAQWFTGNVPSLYYLNIYPIIIFIVFLSSGFLVQADVINNLKAENEEPNLSPPEISSTDENERFQGEIIFFHIVEQMDDGLMIGFPLGKDIHTPLKLQLIIPLGPEPLIGMPLFSNTRWAIPLLNKETEPQVQEEEYFLFMNHFYE